MITSSVLIGPSFFFFRTLTSITLRTPSGSLDRYEICAFFPFSSKDKHMGIIVRHESTNQILLLVKGADDVIMTMSQSNDWCEEECGNLAREGLRTLAFAQR